MGKKGAVEVPLPYWKYCRQSQKLTSRQRVNSPKGNYQAPTKCNSRAAPSRAMLVNKQMLLTFGHLSTPLHVNKLCKVERRM